MKLWRYILCLGLVLGFCFSNPVTNSVSAPPLLFVPAKQQGGAEDPAATSLTNFVAYWKTDEESGTRFDQSANDQALTDNNTVTFAAGVKGNAASFASASSEKLSRADSATLSMGDIDYSFCCWVKFTTLTSNAGNGRGIMGKFDIGAGEREWLLYWNDYEGSSLYYVLSSTGNVAEQTALRASSFGAPSTGVWYFVVCWYDAAANTANIQVNNSTVDSTSYTGGSNNGGAVFLFGKYANSSIWDIYHNGLIDEAMVAKRVWTAAERTYLYNSGAGRTYNPGTGKFE
mgnify:FL=1